MSDREHSPVSVYALASPQSVAGMEREIRRIVLELLGVADFERHRFTVSPGAGWLQYMDTAQGGGGAVQSLPDPAVAAERAEAFLRSLRERAASLRANAPDFDPHALLPSARRLGCVPVSARSGFGWAHYLYRAQPTLPLRRSGPSVDVLGTMLEVRVSPLGRIIGFTSRWRPLSGERIEAEFFHYHGGAHDAHAQGGHSQREGEDASELVYILDGDGIPQYYLAPYHRTGSEHGLLIGATPYSLAIEFVVRPIGDEPGARITAIVGGGSTRYRFAWGRVALDGGEDDDEGFIDLGEGVGEIVADADQKQFGVSAITVPPGAWVVYVNAKDMKTGAFKHHQQNVFTGRQIVEAEAE